MREIVRSMRSSATRLVTVFALAGSLAWALAGCAASGSSTSGSGGSGADTGSIPRGSDRVYVESGLSADSMLGAIRAELENQGFSMRSVFAKRRTLETSYRNAGSQIAFRIRAAVDTLGDGGSRATLHGSYIAGRMLQMMPDTALSGAGGRRAAWTDSQAKMAFRVVHQVARSLPHRSISYGPLQN